MSEEDLEFRPTSATINVHLGTEPVDCRRLGNWPGYDDGRVPPFVSIRLGVHVALMSHDPERLDRLAACLTDAATALRAVQANPAGLDR